MKILHAADLHLDTAFTGRDPESVSYLKRQLLAVPQKISQLCQAYDCDLLLLSGDIFDADATAESLHAFKTALAALQIPVCISPGNHDFCAGNSPWLTETWPEHVHIFTQPIIQSISRPQLDCRIYGAGFTSMDCPPLLEQFRAEGNETYHIGLLHGDPVQRKSPYCPITQSQVAASGLHYLALGHIHKAGSFTAGSTLCAWPGCPMGRGNDETGEKGVYLVELNKTATATFLPLDTPRFYDLEAEVLTSPEDALSALLPAVGSEDFYRITFTGESVSFDLNALQRPEFPHLLLRDHTVPPADLWGNITEDSLEGTLFRLLHEALENADAAQADDIQLAARICRRILDGREVALP